MTTAPQVAALSFENIDDAVDALRARGLRLSIARRMVLELLFRETDPVSAEHVGQTLGIDVASVYRNLEMLERHGLVHHVHLGHGPGLYVLVGRGEREYLYCDRCADGHAARAAAARPDPRSAAGEISATRSASPISRWSASAATARARIRPAAAVSHARDPHAH